VVVVVGKHPQQSGTFSGKEQSCALRNQWDPVGLVLQESSDLLVVV
jgi:hypothetical protein